MILILGGRGNMGTRYGKILREMGVDFEVHDIEHGRLEQDSRIRGVLITTPTDAHLGSIHQVTEKFDVPILCEKPIARYAQIIDVIDDWEKAQYNIQMIDQYAFCPRYVSDIPGTLYHSWHSGNDTLPWDCINIIAKADDLDDCHISNTAPRNHWECRINGYDLKLADMGRAYKAMLEQWLDDPKPNYDYIRQAHCKVLELKCKQTVSKGF